MTAETVTTRKTIQRRTKSSKSKARKKKNASVRPGATKPAIARPEVGSETPTKKAIVLELLRREQGATTAEIANATGWRSHSIRGFISGNVGKKMGLRIESGKNESGERVYRIIG
jgi:Protein of unknown function (DUF3489)